MTRSGTLQPTGSLLNTYPLPYWSSPARVPGKTSTLAHRVAHLLAHGADPGRILLLTFSRRAADEMTRRVQRIAAQVSPRHARLVSAGFPWSGTFHSVGARLLREYAGRIGLDPAFSIHDREDSADLMNLVRHELGMSAKDKRFPLKGTCLAIYSAVVNTQQGAGRGASGNVPLVRRMGRRT